MRRQSLISICILIAMLAYWIGCEAYWSNHVSPKDSETLEGLQKRFKDQIRVSDLIRDGRHYKIASGPVPPFYIFSFPSSSPTYVFEDSGTLVDWAFDIGDEGRDSSFKKKWIHPESSK